MVADNALWGALPLPAAIIDAQERIVRLNMQAETFLNASARALSGQRLWDKLLLSTPIENSLARARENGSPLFINDVDVATRGHAPRLCSLQVSPVPDHPGHMLILLHPHDLASRFMSGARSKTSTKSAIGMAEMLAHEIKNPLAGITGAAQLLSMNLEGEDRDLTTLIVEETRRIVKLIDQMEQFGDDRPLSLRSVNIHDVLEKARKSALLGVGGHLLIRKEYDPSLPNTIGDADQLLQVFLNLLRNAAEAIKESGTVTIRTYYKHAFQMRRTDGDGPALPLQVEIIDDGPGIAPEIFENVFDAFVSSKINGTGLGLALTSKIIADHGGLVMAASEPGHTVFSVSLPIAAPLEEG